MKHVLVLRPPEDNMGQCGLCGAENQELRPYGPKGESICGECGMKNPATTKAQFAKPLKEQHDG